MKKSARSLRAHGDLILNWFAARGEYSTGIVEGLNSKTKTRLRIWCGFRASEVMQTVMYQVLGQLVVPAATHRFF